MFYSGADEASVESSRHVIGGYEVVTVTFYGPSLGLRVDQDEYDVSDRQLPRCSSAAAAGRTSTINADSEDEQQYG